MKSLLSDGGLRCLLQRSTGGDCSPLVLHMVLPNGNGRHDLLLKAGGTDALERATEPRTRYLNLGKVALYQVSYARGGVRF